MEMIRGGKAIAIKKYIVRLSSEEHEQLSDFIPLESARRNC